MRELREAKIQDLRDRCNMFCNEFKKKSANKEGVYECEEILTVYFDTLKGHSKKGKLNGGTIKNRKFTVKRLVEKVMKIQNIDWEEVFEGLPEPSRFAQDRAYNIDEIRQICKYSDPRINPVVYFFVSSGARLGCWDYLKWGHISPQRRNGKLLCALVEVYKDTPEQYPTLITAEAYNVLKEWMDFRLRSGERITPDSWVMRDYWDTEEGFTHGIAREPIPLKSSGIKSLIDSAVRRQGLRKNLADGKKRHDVQLCHSFRKYRETQLFHANLKEVDINILQGHANGGMVDHYYRPSADSNNRIDDYLINEFLKAEKFLIVDEKDKEIDEIRKELDKKYEDVKKELQIDTNKQIKEFKNEIEHQSKILVNAAEIIKKKYELQLKNSPISKGIKEIDDLKLKHHGNDPMNMEEEDIMPLVKTNLSDEEIAVLLEIALMKEGINDVTNEGKTYSRKELMEIFKGQATKKE